MVANLDRVTFWSCAHTLVLLGVGALQVFMIRSCVIHPYRSLWQIDLLY
ncbi:unnamed protein product [Strongylus vulgaris]|uniref:Uncharacterized protein n=1 Tax=Strongylus vulgaris TaxID=40348 RepID=A0A3P7KIN5_STRVU|nr:unnamed protein product [Strongylus vulgaris]